MRKLILLVPITSILFAQAKAGIDEFTKIDQVNDWTIERKIDPSLEKITCRASIYKYGTWFGARIRLDINDDLIVPTEYIDQELPDNSTLEIVKRSLKLCRRGFSYILEK